MSAVSDSPSSPPSAPPLHPDVAHLACLLGQWSGKGRGVYPTIESFEYYEQVTIGHVGKPFLAYSQKTRHAITDLPLHAESGYFRPVGSDRVELVIAQPTGIVEMHEGVFHATEQGCSLALASTTVALTPTAQQVDSVTRSIQVHDDLMTYELDMAAVGQELQHHLSARLGR